MFSAGLVKQGGGEFLRPSRQKAECQLQPRQRSVKPLHLRLSFHFSTLGMTMLTSRSHCKVKFNNTRKR